MRLLIEPSPIVEVLVSDKAPEGGTADIVLSLEEAKKAGDAANKIYNHLKDKKILVGHNYSI